MKPFGLLSGKQFRAAPPPSLTSVLYTWSYNQVKSLGGDGVTTPTDRTAEQTITGIFWGYDGSKNLGTPPRMYNQLARNIALKKKNDVHTNARMFALLNLALADAGIACWGNQVLLQLLATRGGHSRIRFRDRPQWSGRWRLRRRKGM